MMSARAALICIFSYVVSASSPRLTAIPAGPFHVDGRRIVDAAGREFLIRGTQLPQFNVPLPEPARGFGADSSTTLSGILQRWNMNAVRVPVRVADALQGTSYLEALRDTVRRANQVQLLVILTAEPLPEQAAEFWGRCAGYFRDDVNLMFDLGDGGPTSLDAVRGAGVSQVVALRWSELHDGNTVYRAGGRYLDTPTDSERDAKYGSIAEHVPVLAISPDLRLDDPRECQAVPRDPTTAEELVQANLDYFDAHGISWTASEFVPGRLIANSFSQDATSLESGWTCGDPAPVVAGMGSVVQFHL